MLNATVLTLHTSSGTTYCSTWGLRRTHGQIEFTWCIRMYSLGSLRSCICAYIAARERDLHGLGARSDATRIKNWKLNGGTCRLGTSCKVTRTDTHAHLINLDHILWILYIHPFTDEGYTWSSPTQISCSKTVPSSKMFAADGCRTVINCPSEQTEVQQIPLRVELRIV